MDSSNLAVIFAPNLLHSNENEKMSTSTEKKIRLQAAVVETLIDHAAEIGKMINAYQRVSVHQPVCSFSFQLLRIIKKTCFLTIPGQVPEFILEKIPSMLGVDVFQSTPSLWGHEDSENESPSERKRRRHRSVGGRYVL